MEPKMHERWAAERVEAYLDDDLPAQDRAAFEAALETSDGLRADVALARRVQAALHALPQRDASAVVLAEARRQAAAAVMPLELRRRPLWPWTSALAAAAAVLLTMAVLRDVRAPGVVTPADPPIVAISPITEPTPAELAAAREDLMKTFAYLGVVHRRGAAVVGNAVLDEGVSPALRTAVDALTLQSNIVQPPDPTGKEI